MQRPSWSIFWMRVLPLQVKNGSTLSWTIQATCPVLINAYVILIATLLLLECLETTAGVRANVSHDSDWRDNEMISTALANRAVVCSDTLVHYLIIRDVEWPIIMIMAARQCPINERGWNEQKMISIVTKCGPGSFIAAIPDWALDARDCAGRKHAVRHMHNTAVIHARFRMTSENKGHWNPRTSLPWARTKEPVRHAFQWSLVSMIIESERMTVV